MTINLRAEWRDRVRHNDGSIESLVEVVARGRGPEGIIVFSAWLFLSNPDARRAFAQALAQHLLDIEVFAGTNVSYDMMMRVVEHELIEDQLARL